jgi:gliding motility-associated protein GldE
LSLSNIIESRIKRKGYNLTVEDLNQALELTTGKDTSKEEKDILKGIVNFGTLSVKQVMRSRMEITALDIETDFHELMDMINKSGYSRIPIYNETIDKIEGILYIKDLLSHIEKDEGFKWQTLLRPGFFVPENKKVDSLLKDFQDKRVHMAIVVDEYGGTAGLITMEDVIEEIVGEINDEFDNDGMRFNKLDEHTFIFEGRTSLNDFCKIVGEEVNVFDQVKGESESLGGLILELHSKLPRVGEKISFDHFVFTVVSVDKKRIKRIRAYTNRSFINPTNLAKG